ncbi:hypothetical protein FKM82_017581 [Ascaphus truei]
MMYEEEEPATEETFVSLLWNGVKTVLVPCMACLGPWGTDSEDSEGDSVVKWEARNGLARHSTYKQSNATLTMNLIDSAIQDGGSRVPGKPGGPVAENIANAKSAESWPGVAPTERPRPVGGYGAKAGAAPTWTVTSSAPVLGQPTIARNQQAVQTTSASTSIGDYGLQTRTRAFDNNASLLGSRRLPDPPSRGRRDSSMPMPAVSTAGRSSDLYRTMHPLWTTISVAHAHLCADSSSRDCGRCRYAGCGTSWCALEGGYESQRTGTRSGNQNRADRENRSPTR